MPWRPRAEERGTILYYENIDRVPTKPVQKKLAHRTGSKTSSTSRGDSIRFTIMAAARESSLTTLFRSSNRYRDLYREVGNDNSYILPERISEVELLPHLTLPDIVAATGWEEFCQFASVSMEDLIAHGARVERVVWMTPSVHIRMDGIDDPLIAYRLAFALGTKALIPGTSTYRNRNLYLHVAESSDEAEATAICDFLMRLVGAASDLSEVDISGECPPRGVATPLSGAGLSLFFQEHQNSLRKVTFYYQKFNGDQCRALATMSRIDVELLMHTCQVTEAAFVDCLQNSGGPLRLHSCLVDGKIMARGLAGQSRVSSLHLQFDQFLPFDTAPSEIFTALANNRSLLELNLQENDISNENWMILCHSLQVHPSLLNMNLQNTNRRARNLAVSFSDESKKERTRAIADMLAENTVLQSIQLSDVEIEETIYRESILPRLKTNVYRPRVDAVNVKAIEDMPFRQKVLCRALLRVRRKPDLVWLFLSHSVDAIVRVDEAVPKYESY
jgi:hypothetical protein